MKKEFGATVPARSESVAGMTPLTIAPEQIRRAQLTVAHNARDAEDCAHLLNMLGLDAPPRPVSNAARWQRGAAF